MVLLDPMNGRANKTLALAIVAMAFATRALPQSEAAAIDATSMRKLERTAAAATSAARTSIGVRLFAASVMPVMALVSPGP